MIARLSKGVSCNQVALGLGCAVSTVVQARRRYLEFGRLGLFDRRAGNGETKVTSAFREELRKVLQRTPQDFGWARTSWTRELLALEMERHQFPRVAVCTMGRGVAENGKLARKQTSSTSRQPRRTDQAITPSPAIAKIAIPRF